MLAQRLTALQILEGKSLGPLYVRTVWLHSRVKCAWLEEEHHCCDTTHLPLLQVSLLIFS